MFSPFYCYYNICKDKALTGTYSTAALVRFLKSIPELEQIGQFHFRNKRPFEHFISITLLRAKQFNSWSDNDADTHTSNLLVIVTSRSNNASHSVEPILLKISHHLNWQLFNEEEEDDDDEGNIDEDDNIIYSIPTASHAPYRYKDEEVDPEYEVEDEEKEDMEDEPEEDDDENIR